MENPPRMRWMGTTLMFGKILLTEKYLKESDIRQDQNRFHVPVNDALLGLLTHDERSRLFDDRDERGRGLVVPTVDPMGKMYDMILKRWPSVEPRKKLVLIRKWGKLVENNGLKPNDFVQLWGNRHNGRLQFYVTVGLVRAEVRR